MELLFEARMFGSFIHSIIETRLKKETHDTEVINY